MSNRSGSSPSSTTSRRSRDRGRHRAGVRVGRRRRRGAGHRQRLGPVLARLRRAGLGQPGGQRGALRPGRDRARCAVRLLVRDRRGRPASRHLPGGVRRALPPQRVVARRRRRPVGGRPRPTAGHRSRVASRSSRRARARRCRLGSPPTTSGGRADRGPHRPGAGDGGARPRRRRRHHRAGARHRPVHGAADAARHPDRRGRLRRQAPGVRRPGAGARATRAGRSGRSLDETGLEVRSPSADARRPSARWCRTPSTSAPTRRRRRTRAALLDLARRDVRARRRPASAARVPAGSRRPTPC